MKLTSIRPRSILTSPQTDVARHAPHLRAPALPSAARLMASLDRGLDRLAYSLAASLPPGLVGALTGRQAPVGVPLLALAGGGGGEVEAPLAPTHFGIFGWGGDDKDAAKAEDARTFREQHGLDDVPELRDHDALHLAIDAGPNWPDEARVAGAEDALLDRDKSADWAKHADDYARGREQGQKLKGWWGKYQDPDA